MSYSILSATICSVFGNYKNFLYTNILAFAGYPAIWSIYWTVWCLQNPVGGGDALGFIVLPFSIIYCLCAVLIAVSVFFIEKWFLKFNKRVPIYKIANNIFYNIY
ncbi:hypothetical protein IKQ21_02490, partial [bacterium]|nr:hypothetical protein [bacterium]